MEPIGRTHRIGTSVIAVQSTFPDEQACHNYLEAVRWPKGVRCLKCEHKGISKFTVGGKKRINKKTGEAQQGPDRYMYQCLKCKYQFQATTGSIFTDTHLPLRTWFMATALICNAKKGISAKQVERDLGVSYKTAWYLCHRIRESITGGATVFSGKVEMDEVFIGGRFDPRRHEVRQGDHKIPVVGVLKRGDEETHSKVQAVQVPRVGKPVIQGIIKERVSFDAQIFTDEGAVYRHLTKTHNHQIVIHSRGEYARGEAHINGIEGFWSLVKRQIIGQHHWVSIKHLRRYLDERVYSFNNRSVDRFGMVMASLLIGSALRYKRLTSEVTVVPEGGTQGDPDSSPA